MISADSYLGDDDLLEIIKRRAGKVLITLV
jgi:hypothetical protein